MKASWQAFHRRRWFRTAAVVMAAAALLAWPAQYVYFYVPLLEFKPVCEDPSARAPRLLILEGPVTAEFVLAMVETVVDSDYLDREVPVIVRGRHVYLPLAYWLSHRHMQQPLAYGDTKIASLRSIYTYSASWRIFIRRWKQGAIDDAVVQEYQFPGGLHDDKPRALEPNECGFLHELAIEGGRFAKAP